ncbi:hypothetical protein YTPLAS72_10400 [Nitrospira sp.]|nr:hypothetical protein YTPLAS72_10400 [Nitrospira sp.]
MGRCGKVTASVGLGLVLCLALGVGAVSAKVQVLSETTLLVGGKKVTGQKELATHPMVKGLLAAFDRAESALKKEDLKALMQFYAPTYDYHGLKANDVRRIWGEVFEHYKALESLHLFSDIKITQKDNELRAEVTCTGGLYGADERSGNRITLDSWFREVHYLVKVDGVWRFLGNAGEVPTGAPFASVPHHPLF